MFRDCQLGVVNDAEIIYTAIGKFCSIAVMVRINPGNHPMWRASQSHFTYRAGHKVVQAHGLLWVNLGGAANGRLLPLNIN